MVSEQQRNKQGRTRTVWGTLRNLLGRDKGVQVDVEKGAASPAREGKQKKPVAKLPLSSSIHEVIRVVCHPPSRPRIPVSDHEQVGRSTIDSHLQQQKEKEWLKVMEEVKVRYPEKAKIFETAWRVGNTEGQTFLGALRETDLEERVQKCRRMPTWWGAEGGRTEYIKTRAKKCRDK